MRKLAQVSEATLTRVRDYAIEEPSYTAAFASWDLGRTGKPISAEAVRLATAELLRLGIVEVIEDGGRRGKVYAYKPVPDYSNGRPDALSEASRRLFPELDASYREQSVKRGEAVPFAGQARGPSGRPGRDRRAQEAGHRVKRARQGT